MTCAAADDVTAWSLLAVVIAIVKAGTPVSALFTIVLAALYVFLMIKFVRPFLGRIGSLYISKEIMPKSIVGIFFLTLIISSYITEIIGIHALFGAFMAGAIMPSNMKFREIFIEKVEDVATLIFLPLFFVYTGLRTEIGLLNDIGLWKIAGVIFLVAVVGKFVGSMIAAKFVGQSWKDSLIIGTLMNTRGLVELVVLNIGYDLGVLSAEIFAMLVIMALATTFMTGPALNFIDWIFKSKETPVPEEISLKNKFKILISFGSSSRGKSLLRLANSFIKNRTDTAIVTAMHLSDGDQYQIDIEAYEEDSFAPIIEEAKILNQEITTFFKVSDNIDSDIIEIANKGDYDLLLIGIRQSIFEGSLLGRILGFTTRFINPENIYNQIIGRDRLFEDSPFDGRTKNIVNKSKLDVGVLIDKGFSKTENIFVPVFTVNDNFILTFVKKLIVNSGSQITIFDFSEQIQTNPEFKEEIRIIEQKAPNNINLVSQKTISKEFLQSQDLMIVSVDSWGGLIVSKSLWLSSIPSTLILKNQQLTYSNYSVKGIN